MGNQMPIGPNIEFTHTPYDLAKAAERIGDTNYPQMKILRRMADLRPHQIEDARKIYPGGIDVESSTASRKIFRFSLD